MRPGIQTQSQTTKNTFGNSQLVPEVLPTQPQIATQNREEYTRPPVFGNLPAREVRRSDHVNNLIQSSQEPVSDQPVEGAFINSNEVEQNTGAMTTEEAPRPSESDQQLKQTALLARRVPLDMSLPGEESPSRLEEAIIRKSKWQRLRRVGTRGLAVCLVLLITLGGLLFSQSYLKLHKVFRGTTATAAALKPNVNPNLLKGEGSGRVNILLLGRGGGNHDAPDLTDTMMLVSVDPVNHKATLLSIPRDLWVNVPGAGVMKINAAWQTGEFKYLGKNSTGSTDPNAISAGFNLVDQTVSQVMGLTIDYNVIVNFQAFKQAVDTVGGVNINVPADLVDPTMAWENGNNPVLAKAGIQNFNGAQALLYVRSRETSSDFARAQRQRDLMLALKDKVITLGTLSDPLKISSLLSNFGNNVSTDLSLSNAGRLYSILKSVNNTDINSLDLASGTNQYVTTGNISGQSVVLPKAGLFQYSQIQQFIRTQLKDPYIIKENAKVFILNGTTMPGLATNMANNLKTYGYNVIGTANTPTSGWEHTMLVNLTANNKYTQHFLEQRLDTQATNSLSDKSIPTNGADFVIIIGNDEANTSQTQAN